MRTILNITLCTVALLANPAGAQVVTETAEITYSTPDNSDDFGAAIAVEGELALIGAPQMFVGPFPGPGAVIAFQRVGDHWQELAELAAPDGHARDQFGVAVDISGEWAVFGADQRSSLRNLGGAAYVYRFVGGEWLYQQKLEAPDTVEFAHYGLFVAIDGDTIAVGAPNAWSGGVRTGAVYVYRRSGSTWALEEKLTASDAHDSSTVGVCDLDGDTLIVGAPGQTVGKVLGAGAGYVFTRNGTHWSQQTKLFAPAPEPGDSLGSDVAIEGDRVAISGRPTQVVRFFERAGASWSHVDDIQGPGGLFGSVIALSGNRLVVGDFFFDDFVTNAGTVYLYEEGNSGWELSQRFVQSMLQNNSEFGLALALEGSQLLVGAPRANSGPAFSGRAYFFDLDQPPVGTGFCFGSTAACPCSNPGASHQGCDSSLNQGGTLVFTGSASTSADDLTANAYAIPDGQSALLFVGDSIVGGPSGLTFGDGLRCAGGHITRIGVQTSDFNYAATWDLSLGASAPWSAGQSSYFQVWYRNTVGGPCGNGFNLTNAVEVEFVP